VEYSVVQFTDTQTALSADNEHTHRPTYNHQPINVSKQANTLYTVSQNLNNYIS